MTVKTNQWDVTLEASESGLLNDLDNQVNGATMRTMSSFFVTAEGAGTLSVTPIINDGVTTLESFEFTNESGHLDFTGAIDLLLEETSGTGSVTVRISSTRVV